MSRAILFSLSLAVSMPVVAAAQPSFDCDDARTATERAICASPGLADLEQRMVGVYRDLVAAIGEREARDIADLQLERRQACEGDRACIERQLLTTIGIFRAEARAASPGADPALSDLRAALGTQEEEAGAAPDTQEAARREAQRARRAGLEAGFARLPDYRQRLVQGRLRDAGYLDGPVDGLWGQASADALHAFLRDAGAAGISFAVERPEGADAAYRYIGSDLFYYGYIPQSAR